MREEVRKGYEESDWPEEYSERRELRSYEKDLLTALVEKLPSHPKVLDLGCGIGLPYDKFFVEQGCEVTGVDVVEENLDVAREHLPDATFIQADFTSLEFDTVFDAVVSFYAIFHIPREEHGELFQQIRGWTKDNGWLLATIGAAAMDEHRNEFLGGDMVWSSYNPEKTLELIKDAGFTIRETYEEHREDAGEHHIWVLAQAT